MSPRSRARWSLAVAFAAHALVALWMLERRSIEAPGAAVQPIEIDVAVEPPVADAPRPPTEAPRPEPNPQAATTPVASRVARAAPSTPETDVPPTAPVVSAQPGSDSSWTFSPTRPPPRGTVAPAAAGSADPLAQATASGVAAVLAEAERKAEARKRKPMIFTPRDLDLGIVPGSQYRSIATGRVRSSLVPLESHALLEFWTDSRGLVARVRVLDASSDRRAWDEVADALVEDAHAAFPLKVPSDADGLIVTLDVTSVMKTLSGAITSRSSLSKALDAVKNPVDTVLDAKGGPQRMVVAKVVGVEAF